MIQAAHRQAPCQVILGIVLGLGLVVAACTNSSGVALPRGVTPETHQWFPITSGTPHAIGRPMPDGAMACESCHAATSNSFKDFTCVGCHGHDQTITDLLHLGRPNEYKFASASCYSCHTNGNSVGFSHFGIQGNCAQCHDVATQFAALPVAGFDHPATGGADCAGCHNTSDWKGATGGAPTNSHDPAQDVSLAALIPTYAGLSISTLSPETEALPQMMNHATTAVDATVLSTCTNCHLDAGAGIYYPGQFHASLAVLTVPQPTVCSDCHTASKPTGFVGPINPSRSPPSGEMKHDAVAWTGGAPSTTAILTADCGVCHQPPGQNISTWSIGASGAAPALMHASLAAAGLPNKPASCIDCHANSRPCPGGDCSVPITAATAPTLPPNVQFDHQSPEALADCVQCHGSTAMPGVSWAGGKFHLAGSNNPKTCLPCHANERPTSTAGWTSTTYTKSPFDYGTSTSGVTHGDGQDCAGCHTGPGSGAWGGTQNWAGATFAHGAGSAAATTCMACHQSQRPTTPVAGFDHSLNGGGDCFGCHQATVMAGSFVNYNNPATGTLPGGDWKGGQQYPGPSLASSGNQSIAVTALQLHRAAPSNLVTSVTSSVETLYNGIVHTSAAIDARISPGTGASPDNTKCWHCHVNNNGTVTAFNGGKFHASLTSFAATPGGAVTAIPQPSSRCDDCHLQMLPTGIVENAASDLMAMDHGATFAAAATIGGVSVTQVSQIDCSVCHKSPGSTWADGRFHASIGTATPKDCLTCHYPLMVDAPRADVTSGAAYAMKHRSGQVTTQACETCHTGAMAKATMTPAAGASWSPGSFHASAAPQPGACIDCHAVSEPAPNAPTKSNVSYVLALGATASNTGQWMNHGSIYVSGKDCVACHAGDAKSAGGAWSKTISFHAQASGVSSCNACHGTGNGGGTTAGTNNNVPVGLTNSTTVTSAASDTTTGLAGTLDQINHADVNVTSHDCSFCHTQVGPSTAAAIQGHEWAQAKFHQSFNAANALVANGTTGRCSNCHLNVKPGASFTGQDHSAFTSASGTTDCGSCHSWPGAGGTASPNWLGASGGVPTTISVGGFTISSPPAANATTAQKGITGLPHPTVGSQSCTACHVTASGGHNALGYDHSSAVDNANCNACHEAGSDLVNPIWNRSTGQANGAGDTRPFTIASLSAKKGGSSCTVTFPNHFYPADCSQCHNEPTGTVRTTTGSAYTTAWAFNHNQSKMKGICNDCHGPCPGD